MTIVTLVLLVVVLALLLLLLAKTSKAGNPMLDSRLDAFDKAQERTERAVREEVAQSREESGKAAREQRQELTEAFKVFGDTSGKRMMEAASVQKAQLDAFSSQLAAFTKASVERLDGVRAESAAGAKQLREEVVATLTSLSETTTRTMRELANVQKGQLESMTLAIGKLSDSNEKKLEAIRGTVEAELQRMQADNAKQLEQMRQTVDEKLQGTLEKVWANPSSRSATVWSRSTKGLVRCRRLPQASAT